MKKRIISMLLVLTMMVGMIPAFAVNVGAKTASQMTEAEAFDAGIDVYIAWYNYNKAYNGIVSDPVQAVFTDENSAFNQLFAQIYPNGVDSDEGIKLLENAYRYLEDHYDGIDQFEQIEDEIAMDILLSCVLYTGDAIANGNNDITETNESDEDILVNGIKTGYSVYSFDPLRSIYKEAFASSSDLTLNKLASSVNTGKLKIGDYSFGVLTSLILGAIDDTNEGIEVLERAAKYDNIKSLSNSEIDILREFETDGLIGEYIKAYTVAYDELWNAGESSFKDKLLSESINRLDTFIDLGSASIKAGAGAIVNSSTSPQWLTTTAKVGQGLIYGFELFNIFEGIWKFSGDALFGQTAMKSSDVTLFYLDYFRNRFYYQYRDAYHNFNNNPNSENAKRLNTYSRMIYEICAASENYASQINNTYATAGLLNFEWMHYIPGKIDPQLTEVAKVQSAQLLQYRSNYYERALGAYSDFIDTSIHHVHFNLNGGAFVAAKQIGYAQSSPILYKIDSMDINIPEGIPVREGYIFIGWTTDSNSQNANPSYAPGNTYSKNEDLTLYAVWKQDASIHYNANGGTGAPASHENTVGSTTLSTTVPTRNGHTFLGWSESATATTSTYQPGAVLTKEGNVTLYAIWQPKTFNIIFDANGGIFKAYNNATTVTRPKVYAQNFTFDVTYPVRDGYKCIGWSLENDNTVDWTNGETENDIGAANANDKRVYAVWVDTTIDVTYDYNDGSGKTDIVPVDIQNSNTHTIQEPINAKESLKNYFKGWMYQDPNGKYWWASDNNDLGKVTVVQPGNQLLLSNDITLYAKWDYYVHYNDGTAFTHDVVRDGNGYVIDAPLHTPSGKEFKSWKGEDANGNVAYYKAGDTINLATDWTLTATWSDGSTVESYVTVSYDANGGRGSIANDEVIAGGRVTLDDGDSLYRSGYEFVGWAEQPNAVSHDYRGGARITVDENITLYAVWKAVSDETIATVTMSADKEIYEPGDTIIITVLANNTDHFYIDADSAKFNVLRQDGSTIHTGGVFVEKNAPTLMFPNNRYRNGREYEVELYIPKNCSDGTYTISIKATDSVLNENGDGNVDGQAAKIAKYSINIVVEDGYKDKVTVNVNKSKVTLHIDDVDTLKATITPSSAKRYLEWYSSNESIVTVTEKSNQNGRIVATGYGTATITADVNGVKDTCTVVVERCTYDQKEVDAEFLKSPATCSSYAVYYKSCECGYHGSSTFTYSEGGYAQHSYINHKCACGEIEYMSVTFMNGNSQWHKIEAQYNSSLNLAQMTSPEATKGYVFAGWYTENGTRIAEGFTVAENIIAHAKFVAGDADGNGKIEKSDSNMIIRYILGETNGVVDDKNALDINKDGKVTIVDAIKVLLYLSGKTDALD